MQLIRKIQAGLPFIHAERLQKDMGLTSQQLADLLQMPVRTLARRRAQGRLHPDESDRVLRAARLFKMTVELFDGNVEGARRWLQTPQFQFSGQLPIDVAATETGARELERLIHQLEHGVLP